MQKKVTILVCAATVRSWTNNAETIEMEAPTDQETDGTERPDETDRHSRKATGRVTETR